MMNSLDEMRRELRERYERLSKNLEFRVKETPGLTGYKPHAQKLVWMPPERFLELVPEPGIWSEDHIRYLKEAMLRGEEIEPLFVDVFSNTCKVWRHEGRHRARAAMELGIEKVPVIIYCLSPQGGFTDYSECEPCDTERLKKWLPNPVKEREMIRRYYEPLPSKPLMPEVKRNFLVQCKHCGEIMPLQYAPAHVRDVHDISLVGRTTEDDFIIIGWRVGEMSTEPQTFLQERRLPLDGDVWRAIREQGLGLDSVGAYWTYEDGVGYVLLKFKPGIKEEYVQRTASAVRQLGYSVRVRRGVVRL